MRKFPKNRCTFVGFMKTIRIGVCRGWGFRVQGFLTFGVLLGGSQEEV